MDTRWRIANRRMDLASSALADADALIEQQRWRGALNRLYYAAFYAARALLATRDLQTSKHASVIALFQQHFVKTGAVDPTLARTLPHSFEVRLESDYQDSSEPTEDEVVLLREEIRRFVAECQTALGQPLGPDEEV